MTDYDVQRLAKAIADRLIEDERFLKNLTRMAPKIDRTLNAKQAADMLGVSKYTVIRMAQMLGGEKRENGRWYFSHNRLEMYIKNQAS